MVSKIARHIVASAMVPEVRDLFYYADGCKVHLDQEPKVFAVDANRLASLGIAQEELEHLRESSRSLLHGYLLVDREALPVTMRFGETGAVQPVYSYGDISVIFLPEIRIEDRDKTLVARIIAFAKKAGAEIRLNHGSRAVLCPSSNLSVDAVNLANRIHEEFRPELVQARMIRAGSMPVNGAEAL